MSRRRGRRRFRRSRARAATSPTFPASAVPAEPQYGRRRLLTVAVISVLVLVAVTTVVALTVTVQSWPDTPEDETPVNLPPYRAWGYRRAGVDPTDPGDTITADSPPTNDPTTPPTDQVKTVPDQTDTPGFDDWDFLSGDKHYDGNIPVRRRVEENDPSKDVPPPDETPATEPTELKLKPDASVETQAKGDLTNTPNMTAVDNVLILSTTELNLYLSSVMNTNMTSRERRHRVIRRIKRVQTVALVVVGLLVAGSLAHNLMAQIT
ncbi:Tubulointerstitial nephritis antigen-like [Branchiostoma belcheri]|nr:Tubulointerstitial nephritis antigen-like [Branchiostoma belcheri]